MDKLIKWTISFCLSIIGVVLLVSAIIMWSEREQTINEPSILDTAPFEVEPHHPCTWMDTDVRRVDGQWYMRRLSVVNAEEVLVSADGLMSGQDVAYMFLASLEVFHLETGRDSVSVGEFIEYMMDGCGD